MRHLFDARRAPGGPEIQQQRLAAQALHVELGARRACRRSSGQRAAAASACVRSGLHFRHATPGARQRRSRRPRRRTEAPRRRGPARRGAAVFGSLRHCSSRARTACRSPRGTAALGVGLEGAADIVMVMDHQVHADRLAQFRAHARQAERLHRLAVETGDGAGLVVHACFRSAPSRPTWGRRRTAGCRCPTAAWPCHARPRRPGTGGTAPAAPSRSAPAGAAPPVRPAGCRRRTARCTRAPPLPPRRCPARRCGRSGRAACTARRLAGPYSRPSSTTMRAAVAAISDFTLSIWVHSALIAQWPQPVQCLATRRPACKAP